MVISSLLAAIAPPVLPTEPVAYRATATWEQYANGDYQLSTIERHLTLHAVPNGAGWVLDIRTELLRLLQPADPEPVVVLAQRLATLYAHIQLQLVPTGHPVAVLNHAELQQAWAAIAQAIRAEMAPDDPVTATLLAFGERQITSPAQVLDSLTLDYFYQAPLLPFGNQTTGRDRQFACFFDKTSLWFSEQLTLLPTARPEEQLALRCHGPLNTQRTEKAAVQTRIAEALRVAPAPAGSPPLPPELPTPCFWYDARYVLDVPTGLPLQVMLGVHTRLEQLFNKEYTLIIHRV